MKTELLQRALEIQHTNSINLRKNESNYAFTFIYPPSKMLYPINAHAIENKIIKTANLYIHIPYCTGRCTYCYFGCYVLGKAPMLKQHYIEKMCREIEIMNSLYGKVKILSIHFGGGTPTTLSEQQINTIFEKIRECFDIEPGIEITFESSPETLTEAKLECMIANGVNRLNIGVQTLNDELLIKINRRHNSEMALEGINSAKKLGIRNINVDVMYGLKGQSIQDWIETLDIVLNMGVQSVSTYRLRIHPNGRLKNDIVDFNEDIAIEMYVTMLDIMKKYDFYQCSSHKFAIKEEMAQKQIINKRGIGKNTLLPIGMAAYGNIDNVVYWNERRMEKYVERIDNNQIPISIGYVLNKTEEMAKACVLGIHNIHGIDLVKFREKFGIEIKQVYGDLIQKLVEYELIEIDEAKLKPSKLGMIFADEIATEFYSEQVKAKLKMYNDKYGIFFDEILD